MKKEIIGWKAFYPDGKVRKSNKHKWRDIPTENLVVLKRFFKLYDDEGNKIVDEASGKSIFYELISGQNTCILSQDFLNPYKKLPKVIKRMSRDEEQIKKYLEKAEEDQEEPWQTNTTQERQES